MSLVQLIQVLPYWFSFFVFIEVLNYLNCSDTF